MNGPLRSFISFVRGKVAKCMTSQSSIAILLPASSMFPCLQRLLCKHVCIHSPLIIILVLMLSYFPSLLAKDFGIKGELFQVTEESLIAVMQQIYTQKTTTQTIETTLQTLQSSAKYPTSPKIPPPATCHRTYFYDPTFITKETITDVKGAVIFPKGTKVNPLQHLILSTSLLFLDGDNIDHLQWARKQPPSFKWILVKGNPFHLEEQEKRPVYFDQHGYSVSKFRIQHIPARISQEGTRLKIEEFATTELENHS